MTFRAELFTVARSTPQYTTQLMNKIRSHSDKEHYPFQGGFRQHEATARALHAIITLDIPNANPDSIEEIVTTVIGMMVDNCLKFVTTGVTAEDMGAEFSAALNSMLAEFYVMNGIDEYACSTEEVEVLVKYFQEQPPDIAAMVGMTNQIIAG